MPDGLAAPVMPQYAAPTCCCNARSASTIKSCTTVSHAFAGEVAIALSNAESTDTNSTSLTRRKDCQNRPDCVWRPDAAASRRQKRQIGSQELLSTAISFCLRKHRAENLISLRAFQLYTHCRNGYLGVAAEQELLSREYPS